MSDLSTDSFLELLDAPALLDAQALSPTTIALTPEHLHWAAQRSRSTPTAYPWVIYLQALALQGFEEWLQRHTQDFTLSTDQCSLLHRAQAKAIPAVCNVQVNGFRVCLLVSDSQPDRTIDLPRATVEIPALVPHFYVAIAIHEEQAAAEVCGVLRYDQLIKRQHTHSLPPEADWSYAVPMDWFDPEVDRLLLYLRCSLPSAIPLPTLPDRTVDLVAMQANLVTLLPQLQAETRPWWQSLTWEQGVAILSTPALLNWLGSQTVPGETAEAVEEPEMGLLSSRDFLTDLLQLLTRPVLNASHWLRNELDTLAEELEWVLLPPLSVGGALRSSGSAEAPSPTDDLESIMTQLERTGLRIPSQARGVYKDLEFSGINLRLYAATMPIVTEGQPPEWLLLLVLGPQLGNHLPQGTRLRVSDLSGVLVQRTLGPRSNSEYLYAQIAGTWDEKFLVSITAPNGTTLTLPPFSFQPEDIQSEDVPEEGQPKTIQPKTIQPENIQPEDNRATDQTADSSFDD